MRPVSVAIVVVLTLAVGVYIGVSGLATQFAVNLDLTRGVASEVVCTPDRLVASVGQTVNFTVTGLDPTLPYSWSADAGRVRYLQDGGIAVVYDTPGVRTVSVFIPGFGNQWQRVACSVDVR